MHDVSGFEFDREELADPTAQVDREGLSGDHRRGRERRVRLSERVAVSRARVHDRKLALEGIRLDRRARRVANFVGAPRHSRGVDEWVVEVVEELRLPLHGADRGIRIALEERGVADARALPVETCTTDGERLVSTRRIAGFGEALTAGFGLRTARDEERK